jgi:hypothetical protein
MGPRGKGAARFRQDLAADFPGFWGRAWTVVTLGIKYATSITAIAGVSFYVVGIAQRLAVLHADHVPVSRGLPLIALQDYLAQGLAIVLSPGTLVLLVGLAGLLLAVVVGTHLYRYLGASDTSSAPVAPVQPAEQDVRAEPAPAERVEGESSRLDAAARRLGRVVLLIGGAALAVSTLIWLFEIVALVPVAKWDLVRPRRYRSWLSVHLSRRRL